MLWACRIPLHLLAEPPDMHRDGAGVPVVAVVPYLREQVLATEYLARVAREELEEVEFFRRQLEWYPIAGNLAQLWANDERADMQRIVEHHRRDAGGLYAPHDGLHAQQDLARAKGLGHIV